MKFRKKILERNLEDDHNISHQSKSAEKSKLKPNFKQNSTSVNVEAKTTKVDVDGLFRELYKN